MDLTMDGVFQSTVALMAGVLPIIMGILIGGIVLIVGVVAGIQLYRSSPKPRRKRRNEIVVPLRRHRGIS